MFWYGTFQSEVMIANSLKAYSNEFVINDNVWIQSACPAGRLVEYKGILFAKF